MRIEDTIFPLLFKFNSNHQGYSKLSLERYSLLYCQISG